MNDENKYEPYQYGVPQEPQEPQEPEFEESEYIQAEPEFEESEYIEVEPEDVVIENDEPTEEQPRAAQEGSSYQMPTYDYHYSQSNETTQSSRPQKSKGCIAKVATWIALAILFGAIAGVVFQVTNRLFNVYFGEIKESSTTNDEIDSTQIITNKGTTVTSDVADVAESVMPSVVSITNMSIQEVQSFWFGQTIQQESYSSGSGIIVGQNDTELLIVTNNHVVESSTELTVTFIDETNVMAQIKGTDSDMDVAIIAVKLADVEKETMDEIKTATMGDSDALRVGEPTIAIGNALGYGQSVTTGIVSALHRTIEDFEGELIQTDAAINPGNSGGALLNANGEVIGINTAKVSADVVEGMGYAIPISDITDILNVLMNKETKTKVDESERGVLGISGQTVSAQMAQYMPEGVYVYGITEGSGAEKAGLSSGFIITEIEGTSVDSVEELQEQLQYYKVGETVEITIEVPSRNGYVEEKVNVTLGKSSD